MRRAPASLVALLVGGGWWSLVASSINFQLTFFSHSFDARHHLARIK
jgi:hypothetical protein